MPPKVDPKKCVGCGTCVFVCPTEVFELIDGKSRVMNSDACNGCGDCFKYCQGGAITLD